MRPATQKELLENIRDVNWDNILKNADPEHMTYYAFFCYSFDKGAEEMAKIKDAQIGELTKVLEFYTTSVGLSEDTASGRLVTRTTYDNGIMARKALENFRKEGE